MAVTGDAREGLAARYRAALAWARPPDDITRLGARQRVALGLACAEHLVPSLVLQTAAHLRSLPPDLSSDSFRECLSRLWAWLPTGEATVPSCIGDGDARAAHDTPYEGSGFIVFNAYSALWSASRSYADPEAAKWAAAHALEVAGVIAEGILGPRPQPPPPLTVGESAVLSLEWEEAVARHHVVRLEVAAQTAALEALRSGVDLSALREPAQAVGRQVASYAARLL